MVFSEKLDLLMNLSGTSNSALARSINLDASYISRLRRGDRSPSKNENYLKAISQYFAKFVSTDAFRSGLCHALQIPPSQMSLDADHTSGLILEWLYDQKPSQTKSIARLLDQVSHFAFPASSTVFDLTSVMEHLTFEETTTYHGIEGKQKAVLAFLATALASDASETLYLYSDEAMDWLIGDQKFTGQWAMLMSRIIRKGHKIVIVHTVNRGLDEMLSAIREWMPLYMTGAIEPYYYPRTRDDVYKHTLFILEGKMAMVSRSISRSERPPLIHLFTESRTVAHYQFEYEDYLSQCRPLMKILTPGQTDKVLTLLEEFESEKTSSLALREGLPSMTLPVEVLKAVLYRTGIDPVRMTTYLNFQKRRLERLEAHLLDFEHTEMLLLPDRKQFLEHRKGFEGPPQSLEASLASSDVNAGDSFSAHLRLKYASIAGITDAVYGLEDFCSHLSYMLHLLNTYPNYHVILLEETFSKGCTVYIRENVGVVILKDSEPTVLFAINESRLTAAFTDFASLAAGKVRLSGTERKQVIKRLEALYNTLSGKKRERQKVAKSTS